jgi:hypothetical protein
MPYRRPVASDFSIAQAADTRSPGALAVRRPVPVDPEDAAQTDARREPIRSMRHEGDQPEVPGPLENHVAGGRARRTRPRFARLHASIAECPMEWAWQDPPSVVINPGEKAGIAAKLVNARFSPRRHWLGGVAFALLAAGVIWAVAAIQSGRSLPGGGARSADTLMAAHEPGAAQPGPDEAPVSAGAGRERGASTAGLAPAGSEPGVEIALLGPVLASAGEAEEVSAKLSMGTAAAPAAAVGARVAHLLHDPPRPVLKPTLVSLLDARSPRRARPTSRQ